MKWALLSQRANYGASTPKLSIKLCLWKLDKKIKSTHRWSWPLMSSSSGFTGETLGILITQNSLILKWKNLSYNTSYIIILYFLCRIKNWWDQCPWAYTSGHTRWWPVYSRWRYANCTKNGGEICPVIQNMSWWLMLDASKPSSRLQHTALLKYDMSRKYINIQFVFVHGSWMIDQQTLKIYFTPKYYCIFYIW